MLLPVTASRVVPLGPTVIVALGVVASVFVDIAVVVPDDSDDVDVDSTGPDVSVGLLADAVKDLADSSSPLAVVQ